jgi:DNA-binding LacI/PurR family transcriptional regulator
MLESSGNVLLKLFAQIWVIFIAGDRLDPPEIRVMKRIEKASAAELAAAALRVEILGGVWDERLPGARVLAKRLGVSAPTVAAALARLVCEGLLEHGGERRAFKPTVARRSPRRPGANVVSKRLVILTHDEISQLVEVARRLIERLRDEMAAKGWIVDYQVVDFLHVKRPQRSWDRLIQVDSATSVIALYGRAPLAEWAIRRKVRMCFLGGNPDHLPVPMVAVESSRMADVALARLTALGHWRIVMPMCDRAEPFKGRMREAMRRAIEAVGQPYVMEYHNPESDYQKPDVTWRMIESAFVNAPPTAFVFLDWKELVTACCFLARMGLKVPDDVSLVLLSDQMEAEWFQPKLTRFRFPIRRLVRVMVRWLETGDEDTRLTSLAADLIEGATIAPPRR